MISIPRSVRVALPAVAVFLGTYALEGKAGAQSGPGSQTVILPNPTPRPQDPHDLYRDDPVARARQQQILALKREQMHAKVVSDAGNILLLAEQIRNHASKDKASSTAGDDIVGIQQIENLAKRVKENSKVQ